MSIKLNNPLTREQLENLTIPQLKKLISKERNISKQIKKQFELAEQAKKFSVAYVKIEALNLETKLSKHNKARLINEYINISSANRAQGNTLKSAITTQRKTLKGASGNLESAIKSFKKDVINTSLTKQQKYAAVINMYNGDKTKIENLSSEDVIDIYDNGEDVIVRNEKVEEALQELEDTDWVAWGMEKYGFGEF